MELEAPKVLWRSGNLGVGDVLRGLHIQEQSWHPRERNHLTTLLDLHEDDLGFSSSVACLGLRRALGRNRLCSRRRPVCKELYTRGPIPPWGNQDHIGPREILEWPKLLKGSRSSSRPPSEDPVAELANLECWSKRPS